MSYIEPDLEPDAMDLDLQEDTAHTGSVPQVFHDRYCFMCGNGGCLMMCSNCSRSICIGRNTECLGLPVTSRYEDNDVFFICPPCHQTSDRKAKKPSPYYGFYVFRVPDCTPDKTQMLSQTWTSAKPAYDSPAQVRGSAQLIPRSKFLSTGVTILNFRLESFQLDTGDLGKTLEPIASAFFPQKSSLLISESIMFDLTQSPHKHKRNIQKVIKKLSKARWVSQTIILYAIPLASPTWSLGCGLSSTLKTAIILITTHAESGTGYLATSLGHYVDINEWIIQVVTKPILDVINVLDTHWFFFCCGALVNTPSSLESVKSLANKWKPANLFAFDAPAFHPVYATTFLINFFQYIIIEGRTFDSAIGLILNTSALSRHTGIVRLWTCDSVVRNCTLRWAHSRTQPWGEPVPYQCPSCYCIQAWNQKGSGASSELGRDVTMRCSYKGKQGPCRECHVVVRPPTPFKAIKLSEGVWVAFGLENSSSL